jgi:hypothetical protein
MSARYIISGGGGSGGSAISAKYREFILLQYQLHCDESDV